MTITLKMKRMGDVETPAPCYAKPGDAGMDLPAAIRADVECRDAFGTKAEHPYLYAPDGLPWRPVRGKGGRPELHLPPGVSAKIPTGWAFAIPDGYEGQIRPRSSSSARGIYVALGTVDAGYRGEVQIIVENRTGAQLVIKSGDRVAQMVIAPVAKANPVIVDELDQTERGTGGFGSTGK